jgi:hypothetical protein
MFDGSFNLMERILGEKLNSQSIFVFIHPG